MEHLINVHIEKLPEGVYLATSEGVQGPVAQSRTVAETPEIARDVARKLLEALVPGRNVRRESSGIACVEWLMHSSELMKSMKEIRRS